MSQSLTPDGVEPGARFRHTKNHSDKEKVKKGGELRLLIVKTVE